MLDSAAAGPGQVVGRVVGGVAPDTVGAPVHGAVVRLLAPGDTATVAGMATRENGGFNLGPVPAGRYVLAVQLIGYARRQDTVDLSGGRGARVRVRLEAQVLDGPCSGFAVYRVRKPWWRLW